MQPKNMKKLELAKKSLSKRGVLFNELVNGQLQIDGINFWATSEKWYDPKNGEKGQGLNSFVNYLIIQGIIGGMQRDR